MLNVSQQQAVVVLCQLKPFNWQFVCLVTVLLTEVAEPQWDGACKGRGTGAERGGRGGDRSREGRGGGGEGDRSREGRGGEGVGRGGVGGEWRVE